MEEKEEVTQGVTTMCKENCTCDECLETEDVFAGEFYGGDDNLYDY